MRHSYELGGAYYTSNLFLTQVAGFLIAKLFSEFGPTSIRDVIPLSWLYLFFACTLTVTVISFGSFMYLIDPKFRKTFYSFKTGFDHSKAYFLENEDDAHKVLILGYQQGQWTDIADEVQIYTHSK